MSESETSRAWINVRALEQQLLEEFGPPEKVIAAEQHRMRNAYKESHGEEWMDPEQADWEEGTQYGD